MKRIMIAGTKSGVGKTTISMGLMAALSKKMSVQPYKVGPDYIDSAYHSFITGNQCSNLDSYMLSREVIECLFSKNSSNKDISIVEGVMGLFDGAEVGSDIGTSASIAKYLDLPVILVVDGSKVASSLAATVKGFELFDKDLQIAGVIINNVGSKKHYDLLKEAIEYYTDVKPCGYLVKNSAIELPERHLGLVPAYELEGLKETFNILAEQISSTVDLDKILELSLNRKEIIPQINLFKEYRSQKYEKGIKIGIAKDRAFNFYYNDSLQLLSNLFNVEWVEYSPLDDKSLPEDINGLYIGGGFPEMFANEISDNIPMKQSLLKELNAGLPYIAECGGLMYLCNTLRDLEGQIFNMIGWLNGTSEMTKRLQRFGYARLTLNSNTMIGNSGDSIKIHEFHRAKSEVDNKTVYDLEKIRNSQVISKWSCGFEKGNGIAAYAHFHFAGNPSFGKSFVDRCIEYRSRR